MNQNTDLITEWNDCPQCGYPAKRDIFPYTNEFIEKCEYCGKVHIHGIEKDTEVKGYGTLIIEKQNVFVLHKPLSIVEEHELMKKYAEDNNVTYLKWNDEENKLIAIKGQLPKTLEETFLEAYESYGEEQYYHSSFQYDSDNESIPFNQEK